MKKVFRTALFVVVLLASFGVGFAWRDLRTGHGPAVGKLGALVDSSASMTPTELFRYHSGLIQTRYFRDVDRQRLKYAGMEGLFAALGDPHTQFMEPVATKEFSLETHGDFVGIGARLSTDPLGARIAGVFKEGPAAKAGLKSDDVITMVDGKTVAGTDVEDIVQLIRGEPDTMVRLGVIRDGNAKPIHFNILRAKVVVPTAEGQILPKTDIAYIAVSQFAEITPAQFDQALDEVSSSNPSGLVIDLRGNPGGLLDAAADMLSRFVSGKTVVTMRFRNGKEEKVVTPSGLTRSFPYPVVVLVNEDSASAAEIFSGVLRDYKRATLVGAHTYGKASVQNVFTLVDMSSAKVTIARYYLPSGEDIGRRVDDEGQYLSGGLKPDVPAELEDALPPEKSGGAKTPAAIGDPERDTQLRKAIEVIRAKQGKGEQSTSALKGKPTASLACSSWA